MYQKWIRNLSQLPDVLGVCKSSCAKRYMTCDRSRSQVGARFERGSQPVACKAGLV